MKKLLVFHFAVPPYRIDFFNSLNEVFDMRFCAFSSHMISQPFKYEKLKDDLSFEPNWLFSRYRLGFKDIPKGIVKQIREFSPYIIMVSEYGLVTIIVLLYKYLMWKKFKVVSICDDSYYQISEKKDFRWIHRLARRIIAPLLDEVILVEPKVVDWYREKFHKGLFFPIVRDENKYREKLISLFTLEKFKEVTQIEHKNVFLFVGRLVKLKNVDFIIKAFSKLNQARNILVIIGEGPEESELKELSKKYAESVIFTGRLEGDDLLKWYIHSDCLILASIQEPFGAVTNEALLAGCWCLVSKRAGSQCLIKEGVNGFTFDPTNMDELKAKMEQSIGSSFNKDKLRGNKMVWRYQDLMDGLVNKLLCI